MSSALMSTAGTTFVGLRQATKTPLLGCNNKSNYNPWTQKTVSNGSRTHCMKVGHVYRTNSRTPGYYDGRYWTLWKLPMFGCKDPAQVLNEIQECKQAYPNTYIRCLAFNSQKQGQCMSFVIQKPSSATTTN
ncbi:hypothetical protein QJS10_CPA02g01489 [Acorus calamus]|uniref:Ribulose bisphosphate carboxylase small subunit domain-containing protein n=1 Tax=Acorus calamus TaxID=4465 RepID=A0AAV9FCP0_ACOCL|nr:hypothetical protein QJS10_CPA02g01489 [Acorus calamus]